MELNWLRLWILLPVLIGITNPSNDYLEQWYATMSDSRHECPVTSILDSANLDAPEIYTIAKDCSERDARWDYSFLSKVKPKTGVFEGKGRIGVPLKVKRDYRPEHNNYKFGFKHNKCLKFFHDGISRIQGNFVQDRLEGHAKVDFLEDGYLLGQAKHSKLVGIVRYFDDRNRLQNVTIFRKDSVRELTMFKNEFGYFEFVTPQSSSESRVHLTKDFAQVFSCEKEESYLFRNCFESTNLKSEIQKCNIVLEDKTEKPSNPSVLFSWNLKTGETIKNNVNPYEDTPDVWMIDNVFEVLNQWINSMGSDNDPSWKEYSSGHDRIDPRDPKITLDVPEFRDRHIETSVNFTTGPGAGGIINNLLMGNWKNAEITANVPRDQVSDPEWRKLIKIRYDAGLVGGGSKIEVPETESFTGTVGRLKNGKLHGITRRFGRIITDPQDLCGNRIFPGVSYIGRFDEGLPVGPQWRIVIGSGYIYGSVNAKGDFTGDDIAFVYPDFKTAFVGRFEKGIMIHARESEVTGVKMRNGIPELKFSEPLDGPYFHHKLPTHE